MSIYLPRSTTNADARSVSVANLLVIFVATLYKHFEKELFAKTIVTFWRRLVTLTLSSGVGSDLQVGGTMHNFLDVLPQFYIVPPTWGGTTIVCYRLRDNWSGEVGRGVIKVMGPSTYSYADTHSISSAPITGRPWVHYK